RDREGSVFRGRLDRDLALIGKLDGIADEIEHDLRKPTLVAMAYWQIQAYDRGQGELLSGCERLHGYDDGVDNVLERIVPKIKRQLTSFDFGEVEHVVDQAEQVLPIGL